MRVYITFLTPFHTVWLVLDAAMTDYISVSEALKLKSPFKGDNREVLTFTSNVNTAFEVTNPDYSDVL